jgi:nucleoside-diphosphate-sugar epimerase
MRIFVTGASGFIGSAVVKALLGASHSVIGLARSPESAQAITAAGADAHRGSLEDFDSLRAGVAKADGVIHLGFVHDFSNREAAAQIDCRAIETMGGALAGSNRPFVIASVLMGLSNGKTAVESDQAPQMGRYKSDHLALGLAERGVRSCVVRLPPTVHGVGDNRFLPSLIDQARDNSVSIYVGDGANRWPAVHRLDAARLFRLAIERAQAGVSLHAIAEEGVPFRDIATVIGKRLSVPVASKPASEAGAFVGFLSHFIGIDAPASSARTRELIGWKPIEIGLIADLDDEHYFAQRS